MKQDFPLIRGTNDTAEWKTINDHPDILSLSDQVTEHLTITMTASGDISEGDVVILNPNGTVGLIQYHPSTITEEVNVGDYLQKVRYRPVGATWNQSENIFTAIGYLGGVIDNVETRIMTPSLTGDGFEVGQVSTLGSGGIQGRASTICYDHVNDLYLACYATSSSNAAYTRAGTMTTTGAPSAHSFTWGTALYIGGTFSGFTMNSGGDLFYDETTDHFIAGMIDHDSLHSIVTFSVVPSGTYDTVIADSWIGSGSSATVLDYDPLTKQYMGLDTPNTIVASVSGAGILTIHEEQTLPDTRAATFSMCEYNDILVIPGTSFVVICFPGSDNATQYAMSGIIGSGTVTWDEDTRIQINEGFWNYGCQLTWDSSDEKIYATGGSDNSGLELVSLTISDTGQLAESGKESVFAGIAGASFRTIYSPTKEKTFVVYPKGVIEYASWIKAGTSTLTDQNFFGIAQETVTDGQLVIIGRHGFMDSNQMGLTINTNYYVGEYGLPTTDNTQPVLGKAVSDTEIIIKG